VAKLSRNEEDNEKVVVYLLMAANLIGEFTAGVDAEQGRTDFGNQLLSDQLKARLERVDDLQCGVSALAMLEDRRWFSRLTRMRP
jgi:hypothetical protein